MNNKIALATLEQRDRLCGSKGNDRKWCNGNQHSHAKTAFEKATADLGVTLFIADKSNLSDIARLHDFIRKRFGKFDILFINSGITRSGGRFHAQKLAYDAVQEAWIKYSWEILEHKNKAIETTKKDKQRYQPEVFTNGDTLKQLLASSSLPII